MEENILVIAGGRATGKSYISRQLGADADGQLSLATKYYTARVACHEVLLSCDDVDDKTAEIVHGAHAVIVVVDPAVTTTFRTIQKWAVRYGCCAQSSAAHGVRLLVVNSGCSRDSQKSGSKPKTPQWVHAPDTLDWCLENNFEIVELNYVLCSPPPSGTANVRSLLASAGGNETGDITGVQRIHEALLCTMWPSTGSVSESTIVKGPTEAGDVAETPNPNQMLLVTAGDSAALLASVQFLMKGTTSFHMELQNKYYGATVDVAHVSMTSSYDAHTASLARSHASHQYAAMILLCRAGDASAQAMLQSFVSALLREGGAVPETAVLAFAECGKNHHVDPLLHDFAYKHKMEVIELGSQPYDVEDEKEFGSLRLVEVLQCVRWSETARPRPFNPNCIVVVPLSEAFAGAARDVVHALTNGANSRSSRILVRNKYISADVDVRLFDGTLEIHASGCQLVLGVFTAEMSLSDAQTRLRHLVRGSSQDEVCDLVVVCVGSGGSGVDKADDDALDGFGAIELVRTNAHVSSSSDGDDDVGVARLREIIDCVQWPEMKRFDKTGKSELGTEGDDRKREPVEYYPQYSPAPKLAVTVTSEAVVVATCALPPGWCVDPVTKKSVPVSELSEDPEEDNMTRLMAMAGEMKALREMGSKMSDKERRDRAAELALKMAQLTETEEEGDAE